MTRKTPTRPDREQTDESLRTERRKTDIELQQRRHGLEEDSDEVVSRARVQADAVITVARGRADEKDLAASQEARELLAHERQKEDAFLAQERAAADEQLRGEREARERALHDLLSLERETTDLRLLTERTRSDEVLASRDDFLGMVSHDLRSMLGGIALYASILLRPRSGEAPGSNVVSHAEKIQRLTARMNRLIGDLVDVVSIEAGRIRIDPRRDDAARVVREAAEVFLPLAAPKCIRLDTDLPAEPLLASFDRDRILQVLANLLSNALKFTPEEGRILIRVQREGSHLLFVVSDTGTGIPEEKRQAIFERFWQVAAEDRRGLGLGLFISKSIIDAHGGRIWVESQVGEGSSFFFTLPVAASASEITSPSTDASWSAPGRR